MNIYDGFLDGYESLRQRIERNDKTVRFLVWAALGVWAATATIIANLPSSTYTLSMVKSFPPQSTGTMSIECRESDVAQDWVVNSSDEAESAIYTSKLTPKVVNGKRSGFSVAILNGAGSSSPRRPDVDVTLEVTCEREHSAVVLYTTAVLRSLAL